MAYLRTKNDGENVYQYLVESYWDPIEKKTKQRVLKYFGKVIEEKGEKRIIPPSHRMDYITKTIHIGKPLLYYSIIKDIGLKTVIERHCPGHAYNILALVMNQLCYRRSLVKAAEWFNQLPFAEWEGYTGVPLTRNELDSALHSLCQVENGIKTDYGLAIQQELAKYCHTLADERRKHLFYDVTKVTYYGYKCGYAEKGYNPSMRGKWTIGVGLVTTADHGFPVRCGAIPGSKHDTLTLADMIHTITSWGYKGSLMIFDRGMMSADNLRLVRTHRHHAISCCPANRNEVITAMMKWPYDEIVQWRNALKRPSGDLVYLKSWNGELYGQSGKLVVVFNPAKRLIHKSNRDGMIKELNEITDPKRVRELHCALSGVTIDCQGRRGFKVDDALVVEAEKLDGRFLLFCSDKRLRSDRIFRMYFQRDEIEKTFRCLKGELSLGPIRFQRPERIDAYLTIVFLAYLVRSVLNFKLKQTKLGLLIDDAIDIMKGLSWIEYSFKEKPNLVMSRANDNQKRIMDSLNIRTLIPAAHNG